MLRDDARTLQLMAIQHELAMVIGLDLDLDRMLLAFMRTCLRRLGLRSIHFHRCTSHGNGVWTCKGGSQHLSLPAMSPGSSDAEILDRLRDEVTAEMPANPAAATTHAIEGRHYIVYRLPPVGYIVLERANQPIDPLVARSLEPIFQRLAISCRACMEHLRVVEEVAARKEAEAVIVRQATYDSLTDLPNRKTLEQRLRQAVAAARRHEHYGAVCFIDIDRFKAVNDTLGHAAGDELLVEIARRLAAVTRADDIVARVGGDEFVLVATNIGATAEEAEHAAEVLAGRLVGLGDRPVQLTGTTLAVSASVGVAVFSDSPEPAVALEDCCEDLIRFADTAMYHAKERGRGNWALFAPEMEASSNRRLRLEKNLRDALANHELALSFQPVYSRKGDILGAEALLRWHNAELGSVSPVEFIPIAEETGLILEIGEWVLDQACHAIRRIMDSRVCPSFRSLSVNLSPRQIGQPDFVDTVRRCIERAGIPPRALVLEITESAAVADIEDTIDKMSKLGALGVRFALDDFGTGFSSLAHLHRLPVTMLKIDRSFVTGIRGRPNNQGIVNATVAMARHLSIGCVVEGIETREDVDFFDQVPVQAMQGYFFSKPVPESTLMDILRSTVDAASSPVVLRAAG